MVRWMDIWVNEWVGGYHLIYTTFLRAEIVGGFGDAPPRPSFQEGLLPSSGTAVGGCLQRSAPSATSGIASAEESYLTQSHVLPRDVCIQWLIEVVI